MKYFIQKEGVYPQGVFWIGDDIHIGVNRLVILANSDRDNYHDWYLYKYIEQPKGSNITLSVIQFGIRKGQELREHNKKICILK